MKPSTKNSLINLALLTGTLVFFFGSIEAVLRISGLIQMQPSPPQIFQKSADPLISYELRPNVQEKAYRTTVTTNELGFRSAPLDDRPLVAMLGDSIGFGYGVEDDETLAARLEERLPAYQFLNTAAPGYHLGQETAMYKARVATLDPTAVILVFHPNDMHPDTGWLDDDGVLQSSNWTRDVRACNPIMDGPLGYLPGKCWLDIHSAFYRAMKKLIGIRASQLATAEAQKEAQQHPAEDPITPEQIDAYEGQLDAFVALIPEGMPRTFVIWPDYELHAVSRPAIRALAEARGFTVIDLYDTFGNEAPTLGWDTVHPHPDTVARAAEVIAPQLHF